MFIAVPPPVPVGPGQLSMLALLVLPYGCTHAPLALPAALFVLCATALTSRVGMLRCGTDGLYATLPASWGAPTELRVAWEDVVRLSLQVSTVGVIVELVPRMTQGEPVVYRLLVRPAHFDALHEHLEFAQGTGRLPPERVRALRPWWALAGAWCVGLVGGVITGFYGSLVRSEACVAWRLDSTPIAAHLLAGPFVLLATLTLGVVVATHRVVRRWNAAARRHAPRRG